jgi:hypothetical protein
MKKMYKLKVDYYDLKIIIRALNELRTIQINEQKSTEPIDEIMIKAFNILDK